MKLYRGDAFFLLDQLDPKFIVTDCNADCIGLLIKWCEKHDAIFVNAYSTRWLTRADKHDAQKHVAPYRALIEAFPDEPVVCDPFMGSGSIGVAALEAGRDFIGIEKIGEYFEIADKRLHAISLPETHPARAVR